MLTPASVSKELEDLAAQINSPAHTSYADRLRDLASAVAGGPTADAWAFADIRVLLNPAKLTSTRRTAPSNDWFTRRLEDLRNILVLSPLALTWFGIFLAARGYYELVDAKPEQAAQSFIYLWQGGFEGRTPLPLGTLALGDAVLLGLVFLLTLFAYGRSGWLALVNWWQEPRLDPGLTVKLEQALGDADLVLSARRAPQPYAAIHQLEQDVKDFMTQVEAERKRLEDLANRREKELGDLNGVTAQFRDGASTMLDAAHSMMSAQAANMATVDGLTGAIRGLNDTQQTVLDATHETNEQIQALISRQDQVAATAAAGLGKLVSEMGTRVDGVIRAQQDSTRVMADQFDGLIARQTSGIEQFLEAQNQSNSDTAKQVDELIRAGRSEIARAITDQQQATHDVIDHLDGVVEAQKHGTQDLAARLDTVVKDQVQANRDNAGRLESLVLEQQHIAQCLEQYTTEHKASSDEIHSALDIFTQSSRDLAGVSSIASSLALEQGNLIQALRDESAAQEKVAVFVSQATAGVENALLQINDSSKHIRSLAADLTTISNTLPSSLGTIYTDLAAVFREYQNSAQYISGASANLESAVRSIDQSLQQFVPLVNAITDSTNRLAQAVDALEKRSPLFRRS